MFDRGLGQGRNVWERVGEMEKKTDGVPPRFRMTNEDKEFSHEAHFQLTVRNKTGLILGTILSFPFFFLEKILAQTCEIFA